MGLYVPVAGRAVRPPDLAPSLRVAVSGQTGQRTGPRPRRRRSRPGELPLLVAAAILLTFVIKTFLVQAFYIPSESMVPTLHEQDRVLVEKLSYRFRNPERGEVIVFQRPGQREPSGGWSLGRSAREFLAGLGLAQPAGEVDFIKRIIGLPGDTVEVRHGTVLVNGRPLREPYAEPEIRDSSPVIVPPGRYFMMGDNRMNSLDSRFGLGFVPRDDIIGHAFVVLWPPGSATFSLDQDYPGVGTAKLD
ncbi:MAG: signal peptidase I [Egibacteraceae bacterium]